jgi:hypothetical protein
MNQTVMLVLFIASLFLACFNAIFFTMEWAILWVTLSNVFLTIGLWKPTP